MEYENESLRELLKDMFSYNDSKLNPELKERIDNGPWYRCSVHDVQDSNYEMLAHIADLLGMSELYLGDSEVGNQNEN